MPHLLHSTYINVSVCICVCVFSQQSCSDAEVQVYPGLVFTCLQEISRVIMFPANANTTIEFLIEFSSRPYL